MKSRKFIDAVVSAATVATDAPISHVRTMLGAVLAHTSDASLQEAYRELPVDVLGDRQEALEEIVQKLRDEFYAFKAQWEAGIEDDDDPLEAEDAALFDYLYHHLLATEASNGGWLVDFIDLPPILDEIGEDPFVMERLEALDDEGYIKLHSALDGPFAVQLKPWAVVSHAKRADDRFLDVMDKVAIAVVQQGSLSLREAAEEWGYSATLIDCLLQAWSRAGLLDYLQMMGGDGEAHNPSVKLKRAVRQLLQEKT